MPGDAILTLNSGSSSLKFALFGASAHGRRLYHGEIDGIGLSGATFRLRDARDTEVSYVRRPYNTHIEALVQVLAAVDSIANGPRIVAVGHRVAHGGPDCDCPKRVTTPILDRMKRLVHLAPLHLPANIAGIEAVTAMLPGLPQVACFDTAFHHDLPPIAQMTGLPQRFERMGLRRYGFHGLSCEFIVRALRADGIDVDQERIIVAHLGNGASLTAIRGCRSIETTMGFSTLSGVPMGTRSGDVDPGLLLYLLHQKGFSVDDLERLLFTEAGLLGVSGLSSDMRLLLSRPEETAAHAVDYFVYHVRQHLAGLTAPLGGLDRLVFTGGIGANAPQVRARVCEGLAHLGLGLDAGANARGSVRISLPGARVEIEARQTDEEAVIADHVRNVGICRHAHQREPADG
ncbi:MAG: acetate/propionate family kinase [Rhodobacteraceae bacterium]|nr:acetate/propionate family kinase [Paracoccaceae bacterium]